jgi:hypothetical protein
MMKYFATLVVSGAVIFSSLGCTSKVETTDDSTKVEVEAPKVEVGEQPVDLDPSTDADIDVDTPAPGDK